MMNRETWRSEERLRIENLSKHFGGLRAVDSCSFKILPHRIYGLIGPNGSGKTTLFNTITGIFPPTGGSVIFNDEDITGFPSYEITRRGIARTFQLVQIYPEMTVLENLLVGAQSQLGESVVLSLLRTPAVRRETRDLVDKAMSLLRVTEMERLADHRAGDIPYGEQKMVEIMRALMTGPELILLDEPTSGLNPSLVARILDYIRYLRDEEGQTFIIVEHNMRVIMSVCAEIIVLNVGRKIAQGTPEEVSRNPEVIRAYLGE